MTTAKWLFYGNRSQFSIFGGGAWVLGFGVGSKSIADFKTADLNYKKKIGYRFEYEFKKNSNLIIFYDFLELILKPI